MCVSPKLTTHKITHVPTLTLDYIHYLTYHQLTLFYEHKMDSPPLPRSALHYHYR